MTHHRQLRIINKTSYQTAESNLVLFYEMLSFPALFFPQDHGEICVGHTLHISLEPFADIVLHSVLHLTVN